MTGSFVAPSTIPTATNPTQAVLVDVNKDGKLDLVTVGQTADVVGQLAISLGNGNGTFAAPTVLNLAGYPGGNAVAVADYDGDGNVDIALQSPQGFSGVFYGKGGGTFSSIDTGNGLIPVDLIDIFLNGGATVAVDLNKDGKPDIIAGNVILLNIYGSAPVEPVATTTTLTASASGINAGATVTFTAQVAPASGAAIPTGSVNFRDGTATLGSGSLDNTGKATYATSSLAVGVHSIAAAYAGAAGFSASTSAAVSVVTYYCRDPAQLCALAFTHLRQRGQRQHRHFHHQRNSLRRIQLGRKPRLFRRSAERHLQHQHHLGHAQRERRNSNINHPDRRAVSRADSPSNTCNSA